MPIGLSPPCALPLQAWPILTSPHPLPLPPEVLPTEPPDCLCFTALCRVHTKEGNSPPLTRGVQEDTPYRRWGTLPNGGRWALEWGGTPSAGTSSGPARSRTPPSASSLSLNEASFHCCCTVRAVSMSWAANTFAAPAVTSSIVGLMVVPTGSASCMTEGIGHGLQSAFGTRPDTGSGNIPPLDPCAGGRGLPNTALLRWRWQTSVERALPQHLLPPKTVRGCGCCQTLRPLCARGPLHRLQRPCRPPPATPPAPSAPSFEFCGEAPPHCGRLMLSNAAQGLLVAWAVVVEGALRNAHEGLVGVLPPDSHAELASTRFLRDVQSKPPQPSPIRYEAHFGWHRTGPSPTGAALEGGGVQEDFASGCKSGYRRLETVGRQYLPGTKRLEGRWERTEAAGLTVTPKMEGGGESSKPSSSVL